jgi:pimeloyl-ACP methyl ester carboxylesterase
MPEIALTQGRIYYKICGNGEPVIGLHHGMSSSRTWKRQIRAFARHFAFVMYDRLGHGRSERHAAFEQGYLDNRAHELGELISRLGLDAVHLCGMCEGGAIALMFASRWPEKVKSLICQGVGFFATDETISRCEKYFVPWAELRASFRRELVRHHGKDYTMLKWEALRETKPYVWSRSYDLRPRFSGIKAPTLVMAGDKDQFFDVEQSVAAYRGIKEAQLCILPDTGHFPNEQSAAMFNRVVLNFFEKHR